MKKIVIIGPESTGKSTLTNALAQHYNAPFVTEYAREYLENLDRIYNQEDILKIAKAQIQLEDQISSNSHYLFLDTDLIVCKVWSEYKYGYCHPWILSQIEQRHYDYYLLCNIDLAWEKDELREHPNNRKEHFDIFFDELTKLNKPFSIVSGLNRTELSISILESVFKS
jgi:NadR type nicotinamide-nucleotide adenylyltransferase